MHTHAHRQAVTQLTPTPPMPHPAAERRSQNVNSHNFITSFVEKGTLSFDTRGNPLANSSRRFVIRQLLGRHVFYNISSAGTRCNKLYLISALVPVFNDRRGCMFQQFFGVSCLFSIPVAYRFQSAVSSLSVVSIDHSAIHLVRVSPLSE